MLIFNDIAAAIRARDWWEYKIAPILMYFYATAFFLQKPIFPLWSHLLAGTAALVAAAAYVSIINDLTDHIPDALAGKTNRLTAKSPRTQAIFLFVPLLAGTIFVFLWRADFLLDGLYISTWLVFFFYSVPPFRLKEKGSWGILADAFGSSLAPVLFVVTLVYKAANQTPDMLWLCGCALSALAYGIRGILIHQTDDAENDQTSRTTTFVWGRGAAFADRLGLILLLPAELIALAFILIQLRSWAAWTAVGFYLLLILVRWKRGVLPRVVSASPRFTYIVMLELYAVLLPTALLVQSAIAHLPDMVVLCGQLVAFPMLTWHIISSVFRLPVRALKEYSRS